jgi:hypothetical protein
MTEAGTSQAPKVTSLTKAVDGIRIPMYESNSETRLSAVELIAQTHELMNRYASVVENKGNFDAIFFLDKSARPIAYLFRKLYQDYVPELPIPQMRFISVTGNTNWENSFDNPFRFQNNPQAVRETYLPYLEELKAKDRKILVVDDFEATGRTTRATLDLFDQVFPESQITHMVAYTEKPKWYGYTEQMGIMDYVSRYYYGYGEMAARKLSQRTGRHYTMASFCFGENNSARALFEEILDSIIGNIPYLRLAGDHRKVNLAREELDSVVGAVREYKTLLETENVATQ